MEQFISEITGMQWFIVGLVLGTLNAVAASRWGRR